MTVDQKGNESGVVSCKIDLRSGLVEITSPHEHFPMAAGEVRRILELKSPSVGAENGSQAKEVIQTDNGVASNTAPKPIDKTAAAKRGSRSTASSSARLGRIGSFVMVDFDWTEQSERQHLDFYKLKAPARQDEKVSVAMCSGEKLLNKKSFSYNEIYTLMHLGNEKPLPKALDVLISAMAKANWIQREGDGFSLKFQARDHVERNLPVDSE